MTKSSYSFPFPDREGAMQELKQDLLYHKIPEEQIPAIVTEAWESGVRAARTIRTIWPAEDASLILKAKQVTVTEVDQDCVIGNTRYFSDYYSGKKEINLYLCSIQKWADFHHIPMEEAKNIILFHELFHHLECHEPELIHLKHTIPWIRIGKYSIGKRKLHAQSEIGAYGFSRTCYEYKTISTGKEV